jgi:hypothetical protein
MIPFLAFPEEIRRIVYTTNTVESLHMQIRKTIKTRGHFPKRRRRTAADLARDHARQNELAQLLQLDERDGRPTHPLRRPHPRQHLTTPIHRKPRYRSQPNRCAENRASVSAASRAIVTD